MLSSVAGDSLHKYISKIIPALIQSLEELQPDENVEVRNDLFFYLVISICGKGSNGNDQELFCFITSNLSQYSKLVILLLSQLLINNDKVSYIPPTILLLTKAINLIVFKNPFAWMIYNSLQDEVLSDQENMKQVKDHLANSIYKANSV